jgi:hypothetical protein
MAFLASANDAYNDPEVTIVGEPSTSGPQPVPTTPIDLTPELPQLPPEQVDIPSVTITIEAAQITPEPVAPEDMPEPIVVESQES